MPSKKKDQHQPKCANRRLLETLSIKDLAQCAPISEQCNGPGPSECAPISTQCNGPGPAECAPISKPCNDPGPSVCDHCKSEEDDSDPGCCSADRTSEKVSRSCPRKEVEPECKVPADQLEAMINDIRSCRDFFQKLTLEAQDFLDPRNSQHSSCSACDPQYERYAQKQNKPIESCCNTDVEDERIKPNKRAKPMVQKRSSGCSKTLMFSPTTCSSLEDQATSKLYAMPPTPPRTSSRNISVPLAQTAYKVREGRLSKGNQADSNIGFEVTDGNTTPEGKSKKKICGNFFQKILGRTKSDCSCDEEMLKRTTGSSTNEEIKQNKGRKPDCFCEETATKGDKKENPCPCCFPPAYNLHFNCTGQMSGNCCCDKSV